MSLEEIKDERLVCLLYELLRDELPAGVVERLVRSAVEVNGVPPTYTNKHLESYAREIVKRLTYG